MEDEPCIYNIMQTKAQYYGANVLTIFETFSKLIVIISFRHQISYFGV